MPRCPIDNVELEIAPTEDPAASSFYTFYDCPTHKIRFMNFGLMGLVPIPKAIVTNPPEGYEQVTNLYRKTGTNELHYKSENSGSISAQVGSVSEFHISLISLFTEATF